MTEFKPGSIEHRKKVIEKYHIEDNQKILDMPYDKFEIFCTGLAVGEKYGGLRATYSVLKNPDPQQVIDMMHELSEEDLNKVLDEWCEPLEEVELSGDDEPCSTCLYSSNWETTSEVAEPCKTCCNTENYDLWTSPEAKNETEETTKAE